MCYTTARKITEDLALSAHNDDELPRSLPCLVVTLPPRGHGRGVPIQPLVQPRRGGRDRLAAWISFASQPGPGRRVTPADLMEALRQIGRSRN